MCKIRYCIILGICFIILFIGLSSCCNNLKNLYTTNYVSDTDIQQNIRDLYIEILKGNAQCFIYTNFVNGNRNNDEIKGEYIFFKNFLYTSDDEYIGNIMQFTVVDMADNGIPEIVLSIGHIQDRLVLHYDNGIIYGYIFGHRCMNILKKDGTFGWSSGAPLNGYSKLRFLNGIYEIDEICKVDASKFLSHESESALFYINNEQVSEDLYESFLDEQDKKEDVEWYEFNEETISDDLVNAWNRW